MKVSIITPAMNSASTIRDAIESVVSQDYKDIEYIVVVGETTDDTIEIVKKYSKRISHMISEPDEGIYDAMNKGINIASGEIVGILNSDDFLATSDVVSRIVAAFQNDESIDGVYSNLVYVKKNNPDKVVRRWIPGPFRNNLFFKGWHPPHPTLYLKKKIYEDFGIFNLRFCLAADFELMLRLFEKHKINTEYINYTTVVMRLGGATNKNLTNIRKQNNECLKAFGINGFKVPKFYLLFRFSSKLLQYLK